MELCRRNCEWEADDASLLGRGEGRRGADGEDAAVRARGHARNRSASRDAARVRGRIRADVGEAGRHRRGCHLRRELGGGAAGERARARSPRASPGQRGAEAGCVFLRGGARPPLPEVVAFIDANKDDLVDGRRLGVEHICRQLQVAPSSYYAAKTRTPSARAQRDEELIPRLVELWEANYRVYGVRKLWKAARRAGIAIGRDQTARLMKVAGIEGARRSKRVKTTRPDPASARHPDLVNREFTAAAPNRLWVTDLTFVPTRAGVAYVCFIIDVFSRMIVGWR